jgi:LacI family transcriptional regulator
MYDRLRGYEEAINDHQLESYIKKINYSKVDQTAVQEITVLFEDNPQIDALFFATSYLAIKGLEVINNLKLSIPGEVGLIAFDDHEIFKLFRPNITAVTQPVAEMSKQLVNLLLEQIDAPNETRKNKHVVIPATFNIRNSSVRKKTT